MKSLLEIRGYRLMAHLGWSEREREIPQPVDLDINISFADRPLASGTDRLSDTVCYDELLKEVKKFCESRSFRLIEKMGFEIHVLVRQRIEAAAQISVRVTKVQPPIPDLLQGVSFTYED